MRVLFILKTILILSGNLYAQETKLVTRTSADIEKSQKTKEKNTNTSVTEPVRNFIEEYYVLNDDENVRHGTYVKYRHTFRGIQILESGSFENGQLHGFWEYYHDFPLKNTGNSIKEKGHYVNGKRNGVWISYYMDTIPERISQENFGNSKKTDSVNISIDQQSAKTKLVGMYLNDKRIGEWTSFTYAGDIFQKYNFSKKTLIRDPSVTDTLNYNTNRNAVFIGGLPCLIDFLSEAFQLPGTPGDSTSVIVSFTIDKEGAVTDAKVESSSGYKGLETEALRVVALTDRKWIPALAESTAVNSTYRIQFFIVEKKISPTYKQFRVGYRPIFE